MRPSSWIALCAGGAALGGAALLYVTPANAVAPPMTVGLAQKIIGQATQALARRDTNGLMALMAPKARILGGKPEDIRYALDTTFDQMPGHLTVAVRDVSTHMDGSDALVHLTADIGEHDPKMDATYYRGLKMDVKLVKIRSARWLGLFQSEDWRIVDVKSSQNIELPQP